MGQLNTITHGDCRSVMAAMNPRSVDFILTDPPYVTNYRDRSGRTVANDDNAGWLPEAYAQMHRVLKPDAYCVTFYGAHKIDLGWITRHHHFRAFAQTRQHHLHLQRRRVLRLVGDNERVR